jgi:hypothetical protein
MIRLPLILACAVLLSGYSCDGPRVEAVVATVFGEEAARNSAPAAFLTIPDEPEVVALVTEPEVIVPPEPPRCDNYTWRGQVFSCEGTWLRDL